ncbi:MAG: hypothetical protein ACI3ZQ_11115 [Candidatus Cryptobacteroides sp.]
MNIIVRSHNSELCYCRPDTTWERENKDYFVPDFVDELYFCPIIFAKVAKAGKCVGAKFSERYYDSVNFGLLMYAGNPETDLATTSCLDHSSILPFPMYNRIVFDREGNDLTIMRDSEVLFTLPGAAPSDEGAKGAMISLIEDSICKVSTRVSLRIGDFVAAELAAPQLLATRSVADTTDAADAPKPSATSSRTKIEATFCDNELFGFNIVF